MADLPRLPTCTHDGECEVRVMAISVEKEIEGLQRRVDTVERSVVELDRMVNAIDPPGLAQQLAGIIGKAKGAIWGLGVAGLIFLALVGYIILAINTSNQSIQHLNDAILDLTKQLRVQGLVTHSDSYYVGYDEFPQISSDPSIPK
jgi:hypothetical protein